MISVPDLLSWGGGVLMKLKNLSLRRHHHFIHGVAKWNLLNCIVTLSNLCHVAYLNSLKQVLLTVEFQIPRLWT